MHRETTLITTIVAGIVSAFVLAAAASRLRPPPLVGYLAAGVLIGPFTPGYVADTELAPQLAELGVILLMFGVGVHFSLDDLRSVRGVAPPGALARMIAATGLGALLGLSLGRSLAAALLFGLSLSVASTVVRLKALEARGLVGTERGKIAVGWLIVEGLAMVLALVTIPALAGAGGGSRPGRPTPPVATKRLTINVFSVGVLSLSSVGFDMFFRLSRLSSPALLATILAAGPADALVVGGTHDASLLAQRLFAGQSGVTITDASLSLGGTFASGVFTEAGLAAGGLYRAGLYSNLDRTYGLGAPGIVLSSGLVAGLGSDATPPAAALSFKGGLSASVAQQALLEQITGVAPVARSRRAAPSPVSHYDPVQLTVAFDAGEADTLSFLAVFGSEELGALTPGFNDGFGVFLRRDGVDELVSLAPTHGGGAAPVSAQHPSMTAVGGTALDRVLAPGGDAVLRFDVPVTPNSTGNVLTVIIGDGQDSGLDSAVFLASVGGPGAADGLTEATPLLPSAVDEETGAFEFDLVFADLEGVTETIWIDPPVAVGYTYEATDAAFHSITAPSVAEVADLDGYFIEIDGMSPIALASGATHVFATPVSRFKLSGIDPALALDPADPEMFPLGVRLTDRRELRVGISQTPVTATPTVEEPVAPIPLPAGIGLQLTALGVLGLLARLRRRR